MKRILLFTLCVMTGLFAAGCGASGKSVLTVGRDIAPEDVTEFYYTYENINYNAFYQRYRFYTEDGKHMFSHETRERPDDYGPATQDDTTLSGTFELSDEEWAEFFALLEDGTVKKREEYDGDGETGPWLYLCRKNDRSVYQEYSFASYGGLKEFERFCAGLAQEDR